MSEYAKIRARACKLLDSPAGELITEADHLASFFDVSYVEFLDKIYNKRIARLLDRNRAQMKANIRKRWYLSPIVKAQENLYKLMANKDELKKLKGESGNIMEDDKDEDPLLAALNVQDIWED